MIRLVFCIPELNVGGAEKALTDLAVRIDKNRFAVTVYSMESRPKDENSSCVPKLEAAGITVRFFNIDRAFCLCRDLRKIRNALREDQPDIFLSFLFRANFFGRFAARWAGIPLVVSGIRVAEKRKFLGVPLRLLLDRWTSRWVDRFLCVSRSVAAFSAKTGRLPHEKLFVIPNGVEISTPNLTSNSNTAWTQTDSNKEDRIVFVGRLNYQKGLDWLLETTPDWLPKLPATELWLVGEGKERKKLDNQLTESKFNEIRHRIRFVGWRQDATELIAASKLLVLPSRWEGMPNVLLQAMAAGLPVVCTETEGVDEVLGPLAEKQSCPFGDSQRFAELILNIMNNPELADLLGRQNQDRVAGCFALDAVVRRYEDFFEAIRIERNLQAF